MLFIIRDSLVRMSLTKSELLKGVKQKVPNDRSGVRRAKAVFLGGFHPVTTPDGIDRDGHGEVAEARGCSKIM